MNATGRKSRMKESAHAVPMPNMPLSMTFLLTAICRHHKIDIGDTTTVMSKRRLKIAMKRSSDFWTPHDPPGREWSHRYAIGWQIRQLARIVPTKKAALKAKSAPQTKRKERAGKT